MNKICNKTLDIKRQIKFMLSSTRTSKAYRGHFAPCLFIFSPKNKRLKSNV